MFFLLYYYENHNAGNRRNGALRFQLDYNDHDSVDNRL